MKHSTCDQENEKQKKKKEREILVRAESVNLSQGVVEF